MVKHKEIVWESASMKEAFQFAVGKMISKKEFDVNLPDYNCDYVLFSDGSAVACLSVWSGPYSEVTPDVDPRDPEWWIGSPEN